MEFKHFLVLYGCGPYYTYIIRPDYKDDVNIKQFFLYRVCSKERDHHRHRHHHHHQQQQQQQQKHQILTSATVHIQLP